MNPRRFFIFFFLLLNFNESRLKGEENNDILGMRLARPTSGFSLETGDFGSGLSIFFSKPLNTNLQLFGQFKIMDVTGDAEMPVRDYWTGYVYKANPFNLWLMPAFIGLKHHPFLGRIANNFSPFAMIAAGPVFIVDTPEYGRFREKLRNIETSYNGGFVIGGGIDFMMQPGRVLSLFMGYDHIRIGDMVEGRKYYGGTVFKIMIGRKLN